MHVYGLILRAGRANNSAIGRYLTRSEKKCLVKAILAIVDILQSTVSHSEVDTKLLYSLAALGWQSWLYILGAVSLERYSATFVTLSMTKECEDYIKAKTDAAAVQNKLAQLHSYSRRVVTSASIRERAATGARPIGTAFEQDLEQLDCLARPPPPTSAPVPVLTGEEWVTIPLPWSEGTRREIVKSEVEEEQHHVEHYHDRLNSGSLQLSGLSLLLRGQRLVNRLPRHQGQRGALPGLGARSELPKSLVSWSLSRKCRHNDIHRWLHQSCREPRRRFMLTSQDVIIIWATIRARHGPCAGTAIYTGPLATCVPGRFRNGRYS